MSFLRSIIPCTSYFPYVTEQMFPLLEDPLPQNDGPSRDREPDIFHLEQ